MLNSTTICLGYENEKQFDKNFEDIYDNTSYQLSKISYFNPDWKEADLVFKKTLLSYNGEAGAFLFSIVDDGYEKGYIIAGNDIKNTIIEYGEYQFLDVASKEIQERYNISVDNQTLYYLGDISYAISGYDTDGNNHFYAITPNECIELDNEEWETLGSTPDSGDSYITNPMLYESGYDEYSSYNVYNYNLSYKIMDNFSSGQVCAPTAATNMMFYWYNRGSYYNRLLYQGAWQYTFNYLKTYMNTSLTDGTASNMIVTGYSNFLNYRGYTCSVSFHSGTNSGRDLIPELNADRPCNLLVYNHYKYSNHSVLALGYQQFVYDHWYGNSYETYIRIADGGSSSPTRFVWGNCSGHWNYVTVRIN